MVKKGDDFMHSTDTGKEDLLEAFMSIFMKFKDKFQELQKKDSTNDAEKKIKKVQSILNSIDTKGLNPQAVEILDRMKVDTGSAIKILSEVSKQKSADLSKELQQKVLDFNKFDSKNEAINKLKNNVELPKNLDKGLENSNEKKPLDQDNEKPKQEKELKKEPSLEMGL